jgi:hypothetical protein
VPSDGGRAQGRQRCHALHVVTSPRRTPVRAARCVANRCCARGRTAYRAYSSGFRMRALTKAGRVSPVLFLLDLTLRVRSPVVHFGAPPLGSTWFSLA